MKGTIIPIVAILVIGALEFYALSKGINGTTLSGALALIAGIAGYKIKAVKDKIIK